MAVALSAKATLPTEWGPDMERPSEGRDTRNRLVATCCLGRQNLRHHGRGGQAAETSIDDDGSAEAFNPSELNYRWKVLCIDAANGKTLGEKTAMAPKVIQVSPSTSATRTLPKPRQPMANGSLPISA